MNEVGGDRVGRRRELAGSDRVVLDRVIHETKRYTGCLLHNNPDLIFHWIHRSEQLGSQRSGPMNSSVFAVT